MRTKRTALIVGGGTGQRMGSDVPKQFLLLQGKPVIFHTIEKFAGLVDQIILVLPQSQFSYWEQLCRQYGMSHNLTLVEGGDTRIGSVMNGLAKAGDEGLVAIHDAVRPLVTKSMIEAAFGFAESGGNAIPVIAARETLRIKKQGATEQVNRADFLMVQTPQCFHLKAITEAYHQLDGTDFTDDAGVFERAGHVICTIEGETTNIKITYKEDLVVAEAILKALTER